MYKIKINNVEKKYEFEELTKVFLNPDNFVMSTENEPFEDLEEDSQAVLIEINKAGHTDKNLIKAEIFDTLSNLTDYVPEWGILTGVRPVKLAGELIRKHGLDEAKQMLRTVYRVNEEKTNLITDTYLYQQEHLGNPDDKSVGIYIGIPFCPTRCVYCSFTSNQASEEKIEHYLVALHKEIDFVAAEMKETGYFAESIYIGGGTPTTLTAVQMDALLAHIKDAFDFSKVTEFTVEAGRPDTITSEKLAVIKKHEVNRISINPQSMKARTLELIGRSHTPEMISEAVRIAKDTKIPMINMDLIAGLPEETPEDFSNTLKQVIDFGAENITVHTLAVKRASRLIEQDKDYHYRQADIVRQMLKEADTELRKNGYIPYYLYRQKHMAGSFENIGWCKPKTEGIYNIRIMEEAQTIAALGAGGISKQYYPMENRLERVPNVSNYEIYIERLDEMLERKKLNLFK